MTADPYIISCLTLNAADYCADLHAMPIEDKTHPEPISNCAIQTFDCDYPAMDMVNTAVNHIRDHTLEAEIMQHCSTSACLNVNREQ